MYRNFNNNSRGGDFGRGRGGRGRGGGRGAVPSIYKNLRCSNATTNKMNVANIVDYRFAEENDVIVLQQQQQQQRQNKISDNSDGFSDSPTTSTLQSGACSSFAKCEEQEVDPFQASLNQFIKAEQDRRISQQHCDHDQANNYHHPHQQTTTTQLFHPYNKQPLKDFPQDKRYFCDNCFRGYNTKFMYNKHLETHVKCTHEGCKFEAQSMSLAKHIVNVHSMGISVKGSQTFNQKWIDERKRKFPSKAAVEESDKAEEEKVARGEVIRASNKFGRFKVEESSTFKKSILSAKMDEIFDAVVTTNQSLKNDHNNSNNRLNNNKNNNNNSNNNENNEAAAAALKIDNCSSSSSNNNNNSSHSISSSSSSSNTNNIAVSTKEKETTTDSSSSSTTTSTIIIESKNDNQEEEEGELIEDENNCGDQNDGKNVTTVFDETSDKLNKLLEEATKKECKNNFGGKEKKKFAKNVDDMEKSTLLEMLLQDDIVHERNVLLQCIRYVVSKNFFLPRTRQ